jgi:hypothetical protein
MASIQGPEFLSGPERQDWDTVQAKREEFIRGWSDGSPIDSTKEGRLWLRKGIRPLLSGQRDELLVQGKRSAVLDYKFGAYRVSDPGENIQLAVYSLLAARSDEAIEEVTCQILSPTFDFKPFTYSRAELDHLYQLVLIVINTLSDPGEPAPGAHCQFCPARLIYPAARNEAENATLAKVIELPLGEPVAPLLSQIRRAQALFKEIESHYKRVLEREPRSVPGWTLEPGAVRRLIDDPVEAFTHLADLLSVQEFLNCCSVSVPDLERTWGRKKGLVAAHVREPFKKFLGSLLTEKRNAPSLKPI